MRTLDTDRLRLRPWEPDDADAAFDLYSRWEVQRFLGVTPRVLETVEEAADRIGRWRALDDGTHGVWAITELDGGTPVGALLLKPIPASGPEPLQPSGDTEIGWHLHPDTWGRGYASEAAAAVLAHGFDRGLPRVVAVTHADNLASQSVCRRIGMTYRGSTDVYYNATCELFDATPGGAWRTVTASVRRTTLEVRGTLPGPESPLPALEPIRALPMATAADAPAAMASRIASGRLGSPLPYARHSDYDRAEEDLRLPALVLENEHLRATVLPTLGGRVWSLRDLGRDRELLFVNPVLRFANFGLTDGWFAGGIEWNLGSTGHWTLSSRPLHAARIRTSTGDGLRLWEWERTRDLVLQVDLVLDGDRLLAHTRVINPDPEPKPLYYWTNIAVPQTSGTRVVSRAQTAWRTDYAGRLTRVAVPHPDSPDVDISYPSRSAYAADYFFETDPPGRFVAAVEPDGHGFAQTGTDELAGRKLFLWGSGPGGRRWQQWLGGESDEAGYAEIQAGWCTTQMEHDVVGGHAEVEWSEAFGAVAVDPEVVAAPFVEAADAVARVVHADVAPWSLAERHERWRAEVADAAPLEVLHVGSGWGRREQTIRHGEARLPASALPFPEVAEQDTIPGVSRRWRTAYADARRDDDPWTRYARAVGAHVDGDLATAQAEYEEAVRLADGAGAEPPVGAVRGLALLASTRGDHAAARGHDARALALAPADRILLTEAVGRLIDAGEPTAALAVLDAAPSAVADHGRNRLLRARALLAVGDHDGALAILADGMVVPDLAEGGRELTELWEALRPGDPLPAHLDFRMGEV